MCSEVPQGSIQTVAQGDYNPAQRCSETLQAQNKTGYNNYYMVDHLGYGNAQAYVNYVAALLCRSLLAILRRVMARE